MAGFFGKNGSDAVAFALTHICRVIIRYHMKLDAAIDQAVTDGIITSDQATAAHLFVDTATVTCGIFQLVAKNSGFGPG
jgi:hypothetical protein